MNNSLLLEIGVEELPAIPFLKELPNIKSKFQKILEERRLEADFEFFYTPRRLVLFSKNFPSHARDITEEIYGPPLEVALKNGEPSKAGIGFLNKVGAKNIEELDRAYKNDKEVLLFKKDIKGEACESLIEGVVVEFLESLSFGKCMRWGSLRSEFIRPIRWILALFGEKVLELEAFGIRSKRYTFLHRSISYEPKNIESISEYFSSLSEGGVVLDAKKREEIIREGVAKIEQEEGVSVELDKELLEEIVAITESPKPLLGSFDEEFLELPPEVIITSMKEHQRYFAVYKDGALTNRFVLTSNSLSKDQSKVTTGNEKVLRARLSDALFFYKNDLKNGLDSKGLESILFLKDLGTLGDKRDREVAIALELFDRYEKKICKESGVEENELRFLVERAVKISKADLLTEMVYEFTELQGIMGYYYAKAANEHELVQKALKEQYLPTGESSPLPSNIFSSIVALSNKLDNLLALFSIGMIPTGTKDPFALRRAALGVLRIIKNLGVSFELNSVIKSLSGEYRDFEIKNLEDFMLERIYSIYKDTNPSIIKAVLETKERDIKKIDEKIEALKSLLSGDNAKEIFSTFRRVANITKDVDISKELKIDPTLFDSEYEEKLFREFAYIDESSFKGAKEELEALFSLKERLDLFFDNVMVNSENEKIRENRKNLIATIYSSFRKFADIKEITI